ncbi:MAG: hypothetical protein GTO51_06245 [Candidatus Latescibacteria bacterium]|nr:hypothetical protein [Candidatus Latescibacterota bacterium]NIM21391.1 hypothetical protein [Candidatus Latescibacterota bacterium]NIM65572.1 hypothetical protein [Candidatus Latescibacterota bacterium]NIO01952.1 hypothetical protein [Candidatus Latescibacterota bacterium]NIO28765.1 hypothetical protein [Candidatus Latescibacterota bacterium]
MKPQKVIIDGYNLIYADDELKRFIAHDLESARNALINRLKAYLEQKALLVTVVFDGRGGLTDAEAVLPTKLQILFSRHDQSADELIIDILRDAPNPREFIVVTSDTFDIGRAASSLGAQVIPSEDFLKRIGGKGTSSETSPEKPPPADEDIEFWLDAFSADEDSEENPSGGDLPKN